MNVAEIKAYKEKVDAQLHEAKDLLNEFKDHAKEKLAESEIGAIAHVKKQQQIEKKSAPRPQSSKRTSGRRKSQI